MENLFLNASREKLRFKLNNGVVTTEDLWDLSLERLDGLAKSLNKEVKESSEESFIKVKSSANKELELKFDIVKYVISVKLAEKEEKKLKLEKAARKEQIMDLIKRKEVANMESKTIEELQGELDKL